MATSYTPLQAAVRKEVRRIQQFVRRAEARGYEFPSNIKNIRFDKTKATNRRLEQLKKWTSEKMYGKAKYASEKTYGEIVSGKRGREIEREQAARQAAETKRERQRQSRQTQEYYEPPDEYYPTVDIIDEVERQLMELPSVVYIKGKQVNVSNYRNPCILIFYNQLRIRGSDEYAQYLMSVQDELFECLSEIQYSDSDLSKVTAYFTRIATLLKGSSLDMEELSKVEDMYDELGW